jgi:RNA polymerase sigma-70 factor (ECF subfamily)
MSATPSEDAFLDRLSRGNPSAAAELDHRYRRRLCGLVRQALDGKLRRREDPEDVVQTVLRTYFRRAARGEFQIADSSDLWALLAKITRRKLIKRAEYHHAEKRELGAETALPFDLAGGRDPQPADAAIAAELVEKTLQGLEPRAGEVFQLRLAGCTEKEIAAELSCTRAEVRLQLKRIRERLKRLEE